MTFCEIRWARLCFTLSCMRFVFQTAPHLPAYVKVLLLSTRGGSWVLRTELPSVMIPYSMHKLHQKPRTGNDYDYDLIDIQMASKGKSLHFQLH